MSNKPVYFLRGTSTFNMPEHDEGRAVAAAWEWVAVKGWATDDYRVAISQVRARSCAHIDRWRGDVLQFFQVQSAPVGFVSVDVICVRHEEADDATQLLQRSRVLELNTGVVAEFHPRALSPQAERSMHAEPYRLPGTAKHAGVALTGLGTHAETWVVDAVLAARDPTALKRQLDLEHVRVSTEHMQGERNQTKEGNTGEWRDQSNVCQQEDLTGASVGAMLLGNQDPATRLVEVESEIDRVRALHAAIQVKPAGAPPPEEDEAAWKREAASLVASIVTGSEGAYAED